MHFNFLVTLPPLYDFRRDPVSSSHLLSMLTFSHVPFSTINPPVELYIFSKGWCLFFMSLGL